MLNVLKNLSIRYYISGVLILLCVIGLSVAWGIYQQRSELNVDMPSGSSVVERMVGMSELESLFDGTPKDTGRYEVIVQRNLFADDRRPHEIQTEPSGGTAGDVQSEAAASGRDDVELVGVTVFGDARRALVRFKRFNDPSKALVVVMGQEVSDPDEPGSAYRYTVVDIVDGAVTLRDGRGEEFLVEVGTLEERARSAAAQATGPPHGVRAGVAPPRPALRQTPRGAPPARVPPPQTAPSVRTSPRSPAASSPRAGWTIGGPPPPTDRSSPGRPALQPLSPVPGPSSQNPSATVPPGGVPGIPAQGPSAEVPPGGVPGLPTQGPSGEIPQGGVPGIPAQGPSSETPPGGVPGLPRQQIQDAPGGSPPEMPQR